MREDLMKLRRIDSHKHYSSGQAGLFHPKNKDTQLILMLLIFFLLGLPGATMAQISEGGLPTSFQKSVSTDIKTIVFSTPDVEALLAEDMREAEMGLPFRFGYPHDVSLGFDNAGIWNELPDGGSLWRLQLICPEAFSINLIYSDFHLPPGATLFLYNKDHSMVLGAFTARNNKAHGKFATGPTRGATCILEYYEPPDVDAPGRLTISRIVHGYKDVFFNKSQKGFGDSGACNINVNCPEGADWADEIRSAGMLLTAGGFRFCSGALVNNVREDMTPYFLTAHHCLSGDVSTWIVMFNYQSPTCANADGPTTDTLSGAALIAANPDSDFALVRWNETPPTEYNVFFAGWTAENIAAASATAIHHPSGDVKKISFDYNPVVSSDYDPWPYLADSHWQVIDWDAGTTEGGSSGSPLFNPDHRIVGQLHGGWAACGNDEPDYYGKFSMSWDRGSSAGTRLHDWLDPDNTSTRVLDGLDSSGSHFPNVEITSPQQDDIVGGSVTIRANADDDEGITHVEFLVNDSSLGIDTSEPYQTTWNSVSFPDGRYTLKAKAVNVGGFDRTATISVVKSDSGYAILVIDLASSNDSGSKIIDALSANAFPAIEAGAVSARDPAEYPVTFVCLGYYSGNHLLTSSEGDILSNYLENGGELYLEGGDTWFYDDPTSVHSYFGINGLSDGNSGNDLGTVSGMPGVFTEVFNFSTEGTAAWVDQLAVKTGITDADLIWQSITGGYSCGVARDTGSVKTIGVSFEFGNIPASARNGVMQKYMDFLGFTRWSFVSYLAHFASMTGQWATELTLTNPTDSPQQILLSLVEEAGDTWGSTELVLPAHGGTSELIATLFPTLSIESGWIEIRSNSNMIKGIVRFTDLTTQGSSSLPVVSETGHDLVLPLIENSTVWESGFAVINTADNQATLTVEAFALNGTLIESVILDPLPPQGKYVRMASQVFSVGLPEKMNLVIHSSTDITGFALSLKTDRTNIVAVPGALLNN